MKKVLYGICMLGLVAMISTSCKKNDEQQGTTFTVSTATWVDEDMKAYYDPNPAQNCFLLETGDKIKVYNINNDDPSKSLSRVFTVDASNQTIHGSAVGTMMDSYYAFYPADMAPENHLGNQNRDRFYFDNEQYAFQIGGPTSTSYTIGNNAVPMCAQSTSDLNFKFYTIYGICNIRLYGPQDSSEEMRVTGIEIVDNEYHISGGYTEFKVNGINQTKIETLMNKFTSSDPTFEAEYASYLQDDLGYLARQNSYTLTYRCENLPGGGVLLNYSNPANFRIGLRPMALSEGFTYRVFFDNEQVCKVTKYQNPNRAYGMVPTTIKNFQLTLPQFGENTEYVTWE